MFNMIYDLVSPPKLWIHDDTLTGQDTVRLFEVSGTRRSPADPPLLADCRGSPADA